MFKRKKLILASVYFWGSVLKRKRKKNTWGQHLEKVPVI